MTEERLVSLIFNRLCGKLTTVEAQELEGWAQQSPENLRFLEKIEGIVEKELGQWRNIDPAEGFAKWQAYRKAERRGKLIRISGVMAAACLILAIVMVSLIGKMKPVVRAATAGVADTYQRSSMHNTATITLSNGQEILLDSAGKGELGIQDGTRLIKDDSGSISYVSGGGVVPTAISYNTLVTSRSGQYHLRLPDGSQAWLNNESSIRYPTSFQGKERTVEVTGEAYFEIAANSAKPFVVKVQNAMVEVLGTSFNIMAYPDEGGIQTTLLTGVIRFNTGTSGVELKPDEQARVDLDGTIKIARGVPSQEIISWKNGFFYFGGIVPFDVVMRQLARWYDVDVVYQGKVPEMEFSGKIDRTLSLADVLKFLDQNQIHSRLEGRKLIVLPN